MSNKFKIGDKILTLNNVPDSAFNNPIKESDIGVIYRIDDNSTYPIVALFNGKDHGYLKYDEIIKVENLPCTDCKFKIGDKVFYCSFSEKTSKYILDNIQLWSTGEVLDIRRKDLDYYITVSLDGKQILSFPEDNLKLAREVISPKCPSINKENVLKTEKVIPKKDESKIHISDEWQTLLYKDNGSLISFKRDDMYLEIDIKRARLTLATLFKGLLSLTDLSNFTYERTSPFKMIHVKPRQNRQELHMFYINYLNTRSKDFEDRLIISTDNCLRVKEGEYKIFIPDILELMVSRGLLENDGKGYSLTKKVLNYKNKALFIKAGEYSKEVLKMSGYTVPEKYVEVIK